MGGNMEHNYIGQQSYDVTRPEITCPECGRKDFFWHCAKNDTLPNGLEYTYDWGDIITCLHCKCQWSIQQINKAA
jgi:hypothetical protein